MYVVSQMLSCVGKNWLAGWAPLRHDYLATMVHLLPRTSDPNTDPCSMLAGPGSALPPGGFAGVRHPSIHSLVD